MFEIPPLPPKPRRSSKRNTKIQIEFNSSDGQETASVQSSRNEIFSPIMPTSATTMDNEVRLTYNLPETTQTSQDEDSQPALLPMETLQQETSMSPSMIQPSLPMLTLYKYNLVQSILSKSLNNIPVNDNTANITIEEIQPVENILKSLTPVSLEDIPVHMLSLAKQPPSLIPLRPRSTSTPTTVPMTNDDDEILESVCAAGFDLPLYSHPLSDWSKLEAREQESANEEAASEASYLDQSWDETQTLPLFEPTLDFDTLMNY